MTHLARTSQRRLRPSIPRRQRLSTACRTPGTRRPPRVGAWPTEMFPGVPSEPQAPSQGPAAERDVCELCPDLWRQGCEGHSCAAGSSRAGRSALPSSPAPRGPAWPAGAVLGCWPRGPVGGGRSQPPVLGSRQQPGSLSHRAVSTAGWAPPEQGSLLGLSLHRPAAVVHPLSLPPRGHPGRGRPPGPREALQEGSPVPGVSTLSLRFSLASGLC